jgi:hypothetical protein
MYIYLATLVETPPSFYGRSRRKRGTIHIIFIICHVSEIANFCSIPYLNYFYQMYPIM